jgi:DNA-binding GntR family transcriptional regulator
MQSNDALTQMHSTYATLARDSVRTMVISGQLAQGDRLNEVALSERFQISRGPLREGIQNLVSEGLLVLRAHRGAYVRSFTAQELADLYSVRTALEVWALKVGAEANAAKLISALDADLEQSQKNVKRNLPAYGHDLDFHRTIVYSNGNAELQDAYHSVMQRIELARSRSANQPTRAVESLDEHRAVISALVDGRIAEAQEALEFHLAAALHSANLAVDHPETRP